MDVIQFFSELLRLIERFDRAVVAPRVREMAGDVAQRANLFFRKINIFRRFDRLFQKLDCFFVLLFFNLLSGDGLQSYDFDVRKFDFLDGFGGGVCQFD